MALLNFIKICKIHKEHNFKIYSDLKSEVYEDLYDPVFEMERVLKLCLVSEENVQLGG